MKKIVPLTWLMAMCLACPIKAGFSPRIIKDSIIIRNDIPMMFHREDKFASLHPIPQKSEAAKNANAILNTPPNDDCINAAPISGFFIGAAWDTREATHDGPGACIITPNIWFLYTATMTGSIQISLLDTFHSTGYIDTRLAVYDGSVCPEPEELPRPTYRPGGETIESAVPITGPLPVVDSGTTEGFSYNYELPCWWSRGETPADVVYSYTATFTGTITVSLCGSQENFNTLLAIVDADGNSLACSNDYQCTDIHSAIYNFPVTNGRTYYIIVSAGRAVPGYCVNEGVYILTVSSPDYTMLGCNQDYGAIYSQLTLDVVQGHQYFIEIGGEGNHPTGYGILSIWPTPPAPPNDDCENAADLGVIGPGNRIVTTGPVNPAATLDCESINNWPELWITFETEETIDLTLSFCGSDEPDSGNFFQYWYTYLNHFCPCDQNPILPDHSDLMECWDYNYGDMVCSWVNLPPGRYYYPIASLSGNDHQYMLTITGVGRQSCGDNALFGQTPSETGTQMFFYGSENAISLACAERFYGIGDTINQVKWWGAFADENLASCISSPHPFEIAFCRNNFSQPSIPGDTIAVYYDTLAPQYTGVSYEQFNEVSFTAAIDPPVVMSSGWIMISGNSADNCFFFWQDALAGTAVQYNGSNWNPLSNNLAFCLKKVNTSGIFNSDDILPLNLSMAQNYPNPFNANTSIHFTLNSPDNVTIIVYDIGGRQVKSLFNGKLATGKHCIVWDGRDNTGNTASSGIYFYSLRTSNGSIIKQMAMVK